MNTTQPTLARSPVRGGLRSGLRSGISAAVALARQAIAALEQLQPLALLAARLYVAQVFFAAGLTKLRDWPTTLALFENEYAVPLLPTELAAVLGTAGELVLPVLLAVGLAGRFAAAGLSVVNIVAVISLAEIAPAAFTQHQLWGVLLAVLLLWGPGRWSADALLLRRWA